MISAMRESATIQIIQSAKMSGINRIVRSAATRLARLTLHLTSLRILRDGYASILSPSFDSGLDNLRHNLSGLFALSYLLGLPSIETCASHFWSLATGSRFQRATVSLAFPSPYVDNPTRDCFACQGVFSLFFHLFRIY